MSQFYRAIWIVWMMRMVGWTLLLSFAFALLITVILYLKEGTPSLSIEILRALFDISLFWFLLALNFAIPLAFFISVKSLFNLPFGGFAFELLTCPKKGESGVIKDIGYGDLLQVWRKFLFLIIYNSAILMLIAVVLSYIFTSYESIFSWFSIYLLYLFILLSGYPSIILLASRCKRVRIVTC